MSRNSRHDRYRGQRSGESARYRRQDAYWDYGSVEPTYNYQYDSYRPSHGHGERYHYASTSAGHSHGQAYHHGEDHTQSFAQYYGGLYGQTSQHGDYSRRHDVYIPNSGRYHDAGHSNYSANHNHHRSHRRRSASPQRNFHMRAQLNSASSPAPIPYVAPPSFRLPPSWPTSDSATPATTPPSHPSTSAPPTGPRGKRSDPVPSSPSPSYLALSLEPSTTIPHPSDSRKLLILDLNGTLLIRSQHHSKRRVVLPSTAESQNGSQAFLDGTISSNEPAPIPTGPAPRLRAVQPRPYIPTFRAYLFAPETKAWLDTMVWSSAQPHSVVDMVDKCFGKTKQELVAVWDRGSLGLGKEDYFKKTQTTKDLAKPWAKLSSDGSLPVVHSALTTLLLDDSPLKARLQPYNHVCIPEYDSKLRGKDLLTLEKLSKAKSAKIVSSTAHTPPSLKIAHSPSDMLVVPSDTQHLSTTNKRKRKSKKQKKAEMESSTSCDSPAGFTDNSRCSSIEVARLLEGGESTTSEEREPSPDETCLPKEEPYDPTLLAVIGVLEALKAQSSVAGWVRSGGLWAGRSQRHAASAEPRFESSADNHVDSHSESLQDHEVGEGSHVKSRGKKRSKNSRTREEITAGAAADILAELSGGTPSSSISPGSHGKVIQTGNDASTVGTISQEDVSMSIDAPEKVAKEENESQESQTMWFEDPRALAYWVAEGRRGLVKLGIEIKHGVEG